ncbi:MAG: response regulator transcription factor [Spirochaetales bacterium]|uniref:Response regulator transcription factor n=1 Tax=Candidatus Thalassospirochaeta sargassi TaxID=3119039 RepID=A0AAJ1IAI6_9SPIO|nr:response regulator transcription factor [Spirochaetales bacterium]
MKATVLIIEDEPQIAELISLYLKKEGIDTKHTLTGEDGLELLQVGNIDLIILDINLPGMDGFEVLQKIRRIEELPVIIVSARQEDEDMIMGFGIGADDYVSKPFSPKVLAARVRANLKRSKNRDSSLDSQISFGPYLLDTGNIWLKKHGERLELSPKEMALLTALAETPEKPFSQEDLYAKIWHNSYGDLTTVSVHIQRLRKKIEKDPANPQYIKTSYGFGYYLCTTGDKNET